MALLKILRHVRRYGFSATVSRILSKAPAYVRSIYQWRIRRCLCCERLSIFLCIGTSPEFRTCLLCSANERYELLAAEIKHRYAGVLEDMEILELDPDSPLRKILSRARKHVRTFYEPTAPRGTSRPDGTICQDLTALTFPNESFDLIVSSDVLEHIPSLHDAFSESQRVLKPGKAHLFTVPPRSRTKKRAELVHGELFHFEPPEYHADPLSPEGILAFWDLGPDLGDVFESSGLRFGVVRGPVGIHNRTVWIAERSEPHAIQTSPATALTMDSKS
jgi:SAM-dependent methyltransferase